MTTRCLLVNWLQRSCGLLESACARVRSIGEMSRDSRFAQDLRQTNKRLEMLLVAWEHNDQLLGSRTTAARAPLPTAGQELLERVQQDTRRLIIAQEQTNEILSGLAAAVIALQASPTPDRAEFESQLDRLIVAQERTNQLLELAIQAGLDDEDRASGR